MNIGAIIAKAKNIYANNNVIVPEHCGVVDEGDGYWVEVYVRVKKDCDTEALHSNAVQTGAHPD